MSASALFPQANSQVYGFNNGYVTVTTLSTGKGYWVRYPSAAQFNICGTPAGVLTVPLVTGWNLVGVYNNAVPVSSITTTPAGIINSVFYEFNNGYVQANTLNAGKGFWVRATQAGTMNLPAEVLEKQIIPEAASIEKGWGRLLFTDAQGNTASLYTAKDGADLSSIDLPPVPPAGIFDVRYESQRGVTIMHANAGQNVILSGAQYPLTLTATDVDIVLKDKATNGKVINKILRNGESVTISNNAVNVLEVGLLAKPTVYELMQNYPNPFNPTTTIRFGLPEKANVTLTVYNQIGERIVTLLQSEKEAGYYSVDWNASNMTSGVYFYEIRTEKFSAVKKLILMK
jgi:hypothetical protein